MVMFFDEKDLLSFGAYMISKERRKFYEARDKSGDDLEFDSKTVNEIDLSNWAYIVNQAAKQQTKTTEDASTNSK
jgi:hypothetical protein